MNTAVDAQKATRREWIGLAVIALPCLLYSMDLTVLNLAIPQVTAALSVVILIATAIVALVILGLFRTVAYGAAMVLHAVSVLVSWRQLFDPWGDPVNHLFIAGVPVLGAFVALFLLRHWDRGVLDAR